MRSAVTECLINDVLFTQSLPHSYKMKAFSNSIVNEDASPKAINLLHISVEKRKYIKTNRTTIMPTFKMFETQKYLER